MRIRIINDNAYVRSDYFVFYFFCLLKTNKECISIYLFVLMKKHKQKGICYHQCYGFLIRIETKLLLILNYEIKQRITK